MKKIYLEYPKERHCYKAVCDFSSSDLNWKILQTSFLGKLFPKLNLYLDDFYIKKDEEIMVLYKGKLLINTISFNYLFERFDFFDIDGFNEKYGGLKTYNEKNNNWWRALWLAKESNYIIETKASSDTILRCLSYDIKDTILSKGSYYYDGIEVFDTDSVIPKPEGNFILLKGYDKAGHETIRKIY